MVEVWVSQTSDFKFEFVYAKDTCWGGLFFSTLSPTSLDAMPPKKPVSQRQKKKKKKERGAEVGRTAGERI